jgi:hypothetical protein
MATARELLEQADALMRKNRGASEIDIPMLTDAIVATPSQMNVVPVAIPVLTESVEDRIVTDGRHEPRAAVVAPVFEGDPSDWLVMDTIDPAMHSVTGKAPDTLAVVPPVTLKVQEPPPMVPDVDLDSPLRATHKAAGSAPTPPPAASSALEALQLLPDEEYLALAAVEYSQPTKASTAPMHHAVADPDADPASASDERWRTVAEQISMQVLQRIDLFTDTGLKEQLARQLQPIVDRASAELVSELNEQVGKLVRSYVAEAIEREIVQWRSEH